MRKTSSGLWLRVEIYLIEHRIGTSDVLMHFKIFSSFKVFPEMDIIGSCVCHVAVLVLAFLFSHLRPAVLDMFCMTVWNFLHLFFAE